LIKNGRASMSAFDAVDGSSTGTLVPSKWVLLGAHSQEEQMQTITTIGLDIAKSVFQLHGIDTAGTVVIRRQLQRRYVLGVFEHRPRWLVRVAAGVNSPRWSRELPALGC